MCLLSLLRLAVRGASAGFPKALLSGISQRLFLYPGQMFFCLGCLLPDTYARACQLGFRLRVSVSCRGLRFLVGGHFRVGISVVTKCVDVCCGKSGGKVFILVV